MMILRSHVLFSDDGETLWASAMGMHRARRGQCKSWWNDDWRDRLLATMAWLSGGEATFVLPLGTTVSAVMSARPIQFVSPVTLNEQARAVVKDLSEDEEDENDGDFE
jgi:hypothetical protein